MSKEMDPGIKYAINAGCVTVLTLTLLMSSCTVLVGLNDSDEILAEAEQTRANAVLQTAKAAQTEANVVVEAEKNKPALAITKAIKDLIEKGHDPVSVRCSLGKTAAPQVCAATIGRGKAIK